ncbi:MAG: phosphate ABC transporter substrate-binding protein PstS [Planctomycetes bacterium]|nr:phosphate ABC transporter substrate-binding protein PstS [Planctomycetota bacterium]
MRTTAHALAFLLYAAGLLALTSCGEPKPAAWSNPVKNTGGDGAASVQGAGATFPAPLYSKWIADFNGNNPNLKVDYQAIGSGGGIKGITDRTVQFGGSDAPLSDEQIKAVPAKILHVPMVSGPVVLVYNLKGIQDVKLDGAATAAIYLGEIKKWNDPQLAALNPGVALPDKDIIVAHRSDGSGTTWIFTNYLAKVSEKWKKEVGNETSVKWPAGIGGKGNPGVAQVVENSEGGIGYVELAYAESAKLPYATQINKAGKPVRASIESVVEAAKNSVSAFPEDMRVSITDATGDASYPICGFTYLLIYEDLSYLKNPQQAELLMKYVNWCVHDGQALAKDLNYARLPPEVQKKVEEKLAKVVCDGKPVLGK